MNTHYDTLLRVVGGVPRYDTPEGPQEVRAKNVVVTVPSWVAADIFRKQSVRWGLDL